MASERASEDSIENSSQPADHRNGELGSFHNNLQEKRKSEMMRATSVS